MSSNHAYTAELTFGASGILVVNFTSPNPTDQGNILVNAQPPPTLTGNAVKPTRPAYAKRVSIRPVTTGCNVSFDGGQTSMPVAPSAVEQRFDLDGLGASSLVLTGGTNGNKVEVAAVLAS